MQLSQKSKNIFENMFSIYFISNLPDFFNILCFLFSASKGRSVASRRSSQSRPVRKTKQGKPEHEKIKSSNHEIQILKIEFATSCRRIICERFTPHFESNFWEAWTRIASSLSRVWASPAFTVIFLSKNNLDLLKQKSFMIIGGL